MLHIITPLYRFELIDIVYNTIPNFPDIKWHISISQRRKLPNNSFFSNDNRVEVYYLDCEDNDMVTKRNKIFENIKDGYFYLLDDDTKFLEEVYNVYKVYSIMNFQGMIIGKQFRRMFNGVAKRPFSNPQSNNIDTGMVIAHHSVLRHVKWEWTQEFSRDCFFWANCYIYFKDENTVRVNQYISHYNFFVPPIPYLKIRKKILKYEIKYDIYNKPIALLYMFLGYIKSLPKKIKVIIK